MVNGALIDAVIDHLEAHDAQLDEALKQSFTQLTGHRDDLVGIGIMSDSDASTLVPIAESEQHRRANQESDPSLATFYAWCPDEWEIRPGSGNTPLDSIAAMVQPLGEGVAEGSDWISFTESVYTWVVDGMARLVDSGWFHEHYPDANVVFHVTDEDIPEENIIEWIEQLNPEERAAPYVAELRGDGDGDGDGD